jgi:hypothetical protein
MNPARPRPEVCLQLGIETGIGIGIGISIYRRYVIQRIMLCPCDRARESERKSAFWVL